MQYVFDFCMICLRIRNENILGLFFTYQCPYFILVRHAHGSFVENPLTLRTFLILFVYI